MNNTNESDTYASETEQTRTEIIESLLGEDDRVARWEVDKNGKTSYYIKTAGNQTWKKITESPAFIGKLIHEAERSSSSRQTVLSVSEEVPPKIFVNYTSPSTKTGHTGQKT